METHINEVKNESSLFKIEDEVKVRESIEKLTKGEDKDMPAAFEKLSKTVRVYK